ncbi:MAG: hypothetical protein AB1758_33120, partial [Candidatus Eremiobacterota bacterium]
DANGRVMVYDPSQLAPNLTGIAADPRGGLYACTLYPIGPDTVYHWNGSAWRVLPPPPARGLVKEGSDWVLRDLGGTPGTLSGLSVDPQGNLYAIWSRTMDATRQNPPDTVYQFVPSSDPPRLQAGLSMVAGVWKVLPGAPRKFYSQSGNLLTVPGGYAPNFNGSSTTSEGDLLLKYAIHRISDGLRLTSTPDTIYVASPQDQTISEVLPPIPRRRAVPDSSMPEGYREVALPGLVDTINSVVGGGQQLPPRLLYAPSSWL